ncbi:hypothetical protein FNV43_RR12330 [Rhamnella rubrinervis]|uniref:Receptor-like serine/threonine-protein kinase n=1 Tax=Rhamnella rubrinervis TaxID=2594499 RepID=A0A8K0H838_9ROSA|nr:hypothetical protein FNV43_RR12330 [Rhamnella rubrinervis]
MAKPKILGPLAFTCSLLIFFLGFRPRPSHAKHTIRPKDAVGVNQTLVSAGAVFELGFFTDHFSGSYYLGIWFAADPNKKPVWVANRESPLIDPSSVLQLRSPDGNLILIDRRQSPFIINSDSIASTTNTTATLLDTGNLVLLSETNNSVIWQSFDHPTDTLLPGMKIGRFGLSSDESIYRVLFSWGSTRSPAPGQFVMGVDNDTLYTLTVWRKDGVRVDIGSLERGKFRFIFENSSGNYNFSYVSTKEETYFSFNSPGNHVLSRWFVMAPNGNLDEYTISPDWKISSVNHHLCEDSGGGNTSKCLVPFQCEDDDNFTEMNGSMLLSGSINVGFNECELMCRSNCSCRAFAAFQGDQTSCQLYYGKKSDLLKIVDNGPGIVHVRGVAPKESGWWCRRQRKKREDQVQNQSQVHIHENEEVRLYRMGSIITKSPNNKDKGSFSVGKLDQLGDRQQDEEFPLFTFSSIETATNFFSQANKVGEGGFGTVYKGRLAGGGQEIAVKRLSKISRQGMEEFVNETSNILLDSNMNPKISDFGMARIFGDEDTGVKPREWLVHIFLLMFSGYMSPEYAMDGLFSEKSDVFSFGVILLEIISGKKNIAFFKTDQSLNLLGKAWNLWKEGKSMELMDLTLGGSGLKGDEITRSVQLGLLCVQERAIDRPTMSDVVFMLSHQSMALPLPKEPAFLSQLNSAADADHSSSSRQRLCSKNYDITNISEIHPR